MPEHGGEADDARAAPAATTTSTLASSSSHAPPGIRDAILGTSLWEAAYDHDQAAAAGAADGDDDEEQELAEAEEQGSLHAYVTVDKASKLGIRVRDDDPRLPNTCYVTHFDPLPATGGPGPVESSGVVSVGDFITKVDDVSVVGKDVRSVLALIRGAADDAVILAFRRLPPEAGGHCPLHLTEQHRALILRHLLSGSTGRPHIALDRLRFLAARGIPDCDRSLRPLVWRILLQYLGANRDEWEAHLNGQRQIYAQFVADLCVLPEVGKPVQQQATEAPAPASSPVPSPSKPKKKKMLVPTELPPPSVSSSRSSFDLDASASFAALSRMPVAARMGSIGSSSTSTSGSGGGLGGSVMGTSAAGSQPHFAYARPRTRVRYQGDKALFDEIKKDVVRTFPDQAFFLDMEHGWRRYDALLRVLFVYAKVNPGMRYVQGYNELVGTIYYVLANDPDPAFGAHAEPDAFFLFTNLMASGLRDLFQQGLDQADSGIEGKIGELLDLLALHDPQLHAHFAAIRLDAHYFTLRWITTLFSRELLLADTIRVWDALLADTSLSDFVLFFCLAMIEDQRDVLLAHGFAECLTLLQNYPSITDVQTLLHRAEALRRHDARVRRGEVDAGGGGGGSPLSPSKLRGVLAKVASTIEEMEMMPAAFDTASAHLKFSFVNMTRRLVENLTLLDGSAGGAGAAGRVEGGKELQPRRVPAAAADAGSDLESEEEEDGIEEGAVGTRG